jgi:hypothetical protein
LSVPLGVVTSTLPVIAPEGAIAFISELETTVNFGAAKPAQLRLGR